MPASPERDGTIQTLADQRRLASEATRGISNSAIYQLFRDVVEELDLQGDLIDFGAGSGALVTELAGMNRFRSLRGVDLMGRPEGIPLSVEWVSADLNQPVMLSAQCTDVLLSSEVIEHLENPRAVAREWFRLLRSGGTLVMSTPNCESWRSVLALVFQGHFAAFGEASYPAHIIALLRRDLSRILKEAGFRDIQFRYVASGGVPKCPGWTWQGLSGGLLHGKRFSDNIMAIATKP